MTQQEETDADNAIQFLQGLEAKHNQVLTELEELNLRIEKVLDEYLASRKQSGELPPELKKAG